MAWGLRTHSSKLVQFKLGFYFRFGPFTMSLRYLSKANCCSGNFHFGNFAQRRQATGISFYGISCRSGFRKNLTNAAKFWFPRQSLNRTGTGFFRRRRKSFGLAKVPDSAETWRHFGCFLVMAGAIKLRRTCKSGKVTSCYDLPPFR